MFTLFCCTTSTKLGIRALANGIEVNQHCKLTSTSILESTLQFYWSISMGLYSTKFHLLVCLRVLLWSRISSYSHLIQTSFLPLVGPTQPMLTKHFIIPSCSILSQLCNNLCVTRLHLGKGGGRGLEPGQDKARRGSDLPIQNTVGKGWGYLPTYFTLNTKY